MGYAKIRPRRGTLEQWNLANPILVEGEVGFVISDKGTGKKPLKMKVGDGVTRFRDLEYAYEQDRVTLVRPSDINGNLRLDDEEHRVYTSPYAVCSTGEDEVEKKCSFDGYILETGSVITVKFTKTNRANDVTLNVEDTGAKPIYYRNAPIHRTKLVANRTYTFRYNGAQYEIVGDLEIPYVDVNKRVVYVSPDGSDETGDGTVDRPWREINYAVQQCPYGNGPRYYINIKPGTYNKRIVIANKIITFTLMGDVTIDVSGETDNNTTDYAVIRATDNSNISITGTGSLTLSNSSYGLTFSRHTLFSTSSSTILVFDNIGTRGIHLNYSDIEIEGQIIVNENCTMTQFIGAYFACRIMFYSSLLDTDVIHEIRSNSIARFCVLTGSSMASFQKLKFIGTVGIAFSVSGASIISYQANNCDFGSAQIWVTDENYPGIVTNGMYDFDEAE